MSDDYRDKLMGLAFPRKRGTDKVKEKFSDDDGTHAGVEVEHWDDSQDAYVRPKTLEYKITQGGEG